VQEIKKSFGRSIVGGASTIMSTNERIERALDYLKRGLKPFVGKKMRATNDEQLDVQALLDIMKKYWPQVFRPSLGHNAYGLIKEVREVRNRWAHQESFSGDEVMQALDTIHEILVAVGALAEAEQVEGLKIIIIDPPWNSVVTTWEQIQQNLFRLEAYRHSQERQESDFYKGLIKRGKCFVVSKRGEQLLFGPSHFVGYANNNLSTHQGNEEKDGRVTNPAIDQLLGCSAEADAFLEGEHHRLCAQLGITAKSGTKRYWLKH
jgi:hypothetical protein